MDRYGIEDADDILQQEYDTQRYLRHATTEEEAREVLRGDPPLAVVRRHDEEWRSR